MPDKEYEEYRFRIDAFTPETLPMGRLAEYLTDLAKLLGEKERVHFVEVKPGSVEIVNRVEREAAPKVHERVRAAKNLDAPPDINRAFKDLNQKLSDDNASARLMDTEGKILKFPGRTQLQEQVFGPFGEHGELDGELFRIGGEQNIVSVHIKDREELVHVCQATRSLAKRLSPYMFEYVTVSGEGRWLRNQHGEWERRRFTIQSFDVIKERRLTEELESIRRIKSPLHGIDDPVAESLKIRRGE